MRTTDKPGSERPDRQLPDRLPGPAVPRLVLGERLRRLREAQYISRQEAGEALRISDAGIAQLERGGRAVHERDVNDLLSIYGITDSAEHATLQALAAQTAVPGWWHPYQDVVPEWFHPYLGLEQAADVIRSYEVQFVPGLLQTPAYARAVISLSSPHLTESRLRRRVELRMLRQRILHCARPPHLWAVVDEAALRRPFGGVETMREQLEHLIAACELPHVTIHVMPFAAGGHAACGGPMTLLRLPERELPDVIYLEHLISASYPSEPEEVEHYRHVIDRLVTSAAPARVTRPFLREILDEM